jgi:uncharacterized protein YjdB
MAAVLTGCGDHFNALTPPLSGKLSLQQSPNIVPEGGTITFGIAHIEASPPGTSTDITWSSSNPSIASISPNGNGTATGVTPGETYIVAKLTAIPSVRDSVRLTVLAPVVVTVVANPHSVSLVEGATTQLASTVTSNTAGLNPAVVWSVSDTSVAKVSLGGLVTAVTAGSALAFVNSVAMPGVRDTVKITVTSFPQVRLISAPFAYDTLKVGQTQNLKLFTVVADSGVTTAYTCASTNTLFAIIDAHTCLLRAIAPSPQGGIQIIATTVGVNLKKGQLTASIGLVVLKP